MKTCIVPDCGKQAKSRGRCHNHYMAIYRQENLEQFRERNRRYYEVNKARIGAKARADRAANPEKIRAKKRAQYAANPDSAKRNAAKWARENRVQHNARNAAWARENKEVVNAKSARYAKRYPAKSRARFAKRRAAQYTGTPAWANHFFIEEIYDLAQLRTKYLGVQHHVDHIVPLQHPLVCGLHVEHNLRVITAFDNMSKKNRHWPDMPT